MSLTEHQESEYYAGLSTQWARTLLSLETPEQQVAWMFDTVERHIDSFEHAAQHANVNSIDCKKGCAHCCYLPVKTLPSIAKVIAIHIADSERDSMKSALNNYTQSTSIQHKPCPFLKDDTCSIYSLRPLSCRTFTSPNVGLCQQNLLAETQIPQQAFRYQLYQAATVALQVVAVKSGNPHEQVDFIPEVLKQLS